MSDFVASRTLAITSDNSSVSANWGAELDQDSIYRIVMSYNMTSGLSTLWVNPITTSSTNVISEAGGTPVTSLSEAAFRISATSNGDKTVDNLLVTTTFAEAVPEPSTWALFGIGASFMLWNMRRRRNLVG